MLYENFPALKGIEKEINAVIDAMIAAYEAGGKLLIAGNGGSSCDAEHIVGELMKGFNEKRAVTDPRIPGALAQNLQGALPAIALTTGIALPTAYLNDVDGEYTVAQALYGLAKPEDVVLLISTSGNAKNLVHAAELASCIGVKSVALTGEGGGKLATICDLAVKVPATETYRVQEYHLPVYHEICAAVEQHFFGSKSVES